MTLIIDGTTLITGDLIRAHEGGRLSMLPDSKIQNRELAVASIKRMASIKDILAVMPGNGWPIFNKGHEALLELSNKL
jgi:hypothetical protein